MNIHEYQAKALLAEYGVPTLRGKVAYTIQEAIDVASELGGSVAVVKAQIHAGGRGKGGGVKLARSPEEVKAAAEQILGKKLVTHQTSPEGQQVRRLYIEQGCEIDRELYLSFVVDRGSGMVAVIASTEGGVDIEEVADKHPEKIIKAIIDPVVGFGSYLGRRIAFGLGFEGSQIGLVTKMLQSLYEAFCDLDVNLLEINPLVVNKEGSIFALDAKMTFDDSALYRHPQIEDLRDEDEEDPNELQAKQHDLNYVKLDGNIGCMVNGAGLAMATMDIIKFYGAAPANFLDVGGGATKEKVAAAFKIILADPNVEAILINIFGGIMRCDVIAEGIVSAAKEVSLTVPMVVRLQGTKSEEGKKILKGSGLDILPADGLADAAQKVVKAAKGDL